MASSVQDFETFGKIIEKQTVFRLFFKQDICSEKIL